MQLSDRSRVARDSDVIYERAYEWHGTISLHDARELGRGWSPRSRVNAALYYLENEGLVEVDLFRGRPFLRLTNPVVALGWARL